MHSRKEPTESGFSQNIRDGHDEQTLAEWKMNCGERRPIDLMEEDTQLLPQISPLFL
jgi:hypothetical protein